VLGLVVGEAVMERDQQLQQMEVKQ